MIILQLPQLANINVEDNTPATTTSKNNIEDNTPVTTTNKN
jgi:hypothetical protein